MSSIDKAESDTHYLKLIGKEDFNSVKRLPQGYASLDLEYFRMETHNLDGGYDIGLASYNTNEHLYVEGQFEGNVIACDGDHFSEGSSGELRIFFKPENVHRVRFAVSPFSCRNISYFEFYGPSGNSLKRIEARSGWINFEVPFQDSKNVSIARVSVYFFVDFGSPVVDSFEMWQWKPYQ